MISLVVMIIGVLLLQEPDLGSLAVISVTVLAMMFLAGVRFLHFMVIMAAGIGGMIILTMVAPYRMNRIAGFIDPWADPFNTGFQLVQALIAFGRGEWFGVGLGASVQKLSYLPAAHTDFLLAILAEEMGLIGVLTVVILFAVLVFRAMKIAQLAEFAGQIFAARLCQGIAVLLGVQAIINMGVNMGLLPTKGLTLPLMSAGGSSLIVSCISVGFLLLVEREVRTKSWPQKKSR
jgi:cell division protein FtsW